MNFSKLTDQVVAKQAAIKTSAHNASYLVESVSLLVVAYYNYVDVINAHVSPFELKVRVAASVVIGLRGAYEFLRYLASKEVR